MRNIVLFAFCLLGFVNVASAVGPPARPDGVPLQSISPTRVGRTQVTGSACSTVAAAGTVIYSVKNVTAIDITATDATYNGVTVTRYWDSDSTAYMPVFSERIDTPGPGILTVTITNVTAANAIICVDRQIYGESP